MGGLLKRENPLKGDNVKAGVNMNLNEILLSLKRD